MKNLHLTISGVSKEKTLSGIYIYVHSFLKITEVVVCDVITGNALSLGAKLIIL